MKNSETLYEYQTSGIETLFQILTQRKEHAALLADPPGAGKTPQAIGVAEKLAAQKILVVCPASLKENWRREFLRWSDREDVCVLRTSEDAVPDDGVIIISYGLLISTAMFKKIEDGRFDFLIVDEAHYVKNARSQTARLILVLLWGRCRYRLLISGTPLPNGRAAEAWTTFSRLDAENFGSWNKFRERYCIEELTKWGIQYPGSKNLSELRSIAETNFMVRRPKSVVLQSLPGIVRTNVCVELPQQKVFEIENGLDVDGILLALDAGIAMETEHITTARRKLAEAKAPLVFDRALQLLEEVEQLVIFVHHRVMFDFLRESFEAEAMPHACISGLTPPDERQAAVDIFQSGEARVFIASIKAANTGLTLTSANTLLMGEYDWVPSVNEQAEGRVFRLTQNEICRVEYLVVSDSLDEKILSVVQRKTKQIEKAVGV